MKLKELLFTSNTAYLPYIQVVATAIVIAYAYYFPQELNQWLLSIIMYVFIGCFGISIGYHRYLTHKSFKLNKFWEYWCTAWGMLAFTGSSIGWVGMHRDHHRYSDKPQDPHSPHHARHFALIAAYNYTPNKWAVRRLINNRFHTFTHEYYFGLIMAWTLIWFAIGGISTMMHVVIIPAVISVWVSTSSNYMNHKWGYINFPTTDKSRNLWINALFTFGEGWHNNHHARPGNYDFGSGTSGKWWEFDMGARVIELIRTK